MLPHDAEAEMAILGGLLIDNGKLDAVDALLSPADFYISSHARLYGVIRDLLLAGLPADEVTVATKALAFDSAAYDYIARLIERVPSSANIESYARIVRDRSLSRRILRIAVDLQANVNTEDPLVLMERAAQQLYELGRTTHDRMLVDAKTAAIAAMRHIEALNKAPTTITGVPTGFNALDDMLGGLQPADLIILGARPSMGKTALMLNFIDRVSTRAQRGTLVVSLEMSIRALSLRILSSKARVNLQRVRRGAFGDADWIRLARATDEYAAAPILFDESPVTRVGDVRRVARRLKSEGKLDLIAIDYLQLMTANTERDSREREVSEMSRNLKQLAKELDVPVLALSQLSRQVESRKDKRPIMSDLRESGAIEQDADVVMFLYRDEVYDPETSDRDIAEVIIAKQRNGATGTVKLQYDKNNQRFEDLHRGEP